MRKPISMLLSILICLSVGIISSCEEVNSISEKKWRNSFSATTFENYTLELIICELNNNPNANESEDSESIKYKFEKNAYLEFSESDDGKPWYNFYEGKAALRDKECFGRIYSAISEKYKNFTYDKHKNTYKTITEINVDFVPGWKTLTITNAEVALDKDKKVTSLIFDCSEVCTEDGQKYYDSEKWVMRFSDYGTTKITDEEKSLSE